MIDIDPPPLCGYRRKPLRSRLRAGHTVQHLTARRKRLSFLLLDCIHVRVVVRVENEGASLDSGEELVLVEMPGLMKEYAATQ
jgi:hypothetical protein